MSRIARIRTVLVASTLVLAACSTAGPVETSPPPATPPPVEATATPPPASEAPAGEQYVANAAEFVKAADWDAKKTVRIELAEMSFTPKDITLEAGQPYVLEVVNVGTEKHEFTAEEFMRTVAARKAETTESEVKVPFFSEIEVFEGKSAEISFTPKDTVLKVGQPYAISVINVGTEKHEFTAEEFFNSIAFRKAEDASGEFKGPAPLEVEVFAGKSIELFLIPTKAGVYDLVCLITGHFEKGMFGTITVVAGG